MSTAPERNELSQRVVRSLLAGSKASLGTIWFLLKIIVPVTLAVALLNWSGGLAVLARLLAPGMGLIGLPGEGALVFLTAILLNIYSAIAVAGSLALSVREATILAIMCLTAHNLIVETAVMRKTGSSALKMVALRIGVALLAAFLYDLLLPASFGERPFSAAVAATRLDFLPMLGSWALSTGRLALKIAVLVLLILVGQRLLDEFKVTDLLSRLFAPFMKFLGLPERLSFLWIIVNVVGYAYGAGVIVERIQSGAMKSRDGDLFNHHAGICHSLLEDTALYLALGLPLFWLTVPRLILAALVVWIERFRRHYFRRSFRAGMA